MCAFSSPLNFSIRASRPRRRRIFEASGGDTARGLRGREGHGYVSPPPHERDAGRPQDPRGTSVMQEASRKKASSLIARAAVLSLAFFGGFFSHPCNGDGLFTFAIIMCKSHCDVHYVLCCPSFLGLKVATEAAC